MSYLTLFWKYKHRNAILAFIGGFGIATLIWLNTGSEKELTRLDNERQQALQREKVALSKLESANSLIKAYKEKDKEEEERLRKLLDQLKKTQNAKTKINPNTFTNRELERFLTERYSN